MKFAHKDEVKDGTKLVADDGFICMDKDREYEVKLHPKCKELYVECSCGKHFLNGQLETDDRYVGLSLKTVE